MSDPWWRTAVVYEIYVRSFSDSNSDGVGDLPGVTARLPYLRALGVDAIWLTPFYRSPMADHGYDVADPRDVDPMFGELADFDHLLVEAHQLGLRVIVDVVPNHTSSQHPWFAAALAAGPGSRERERYLFREGRGPGGADPPNDWDSLFGGPAWSRAADGQWYLHLFTPEQPDLNWDHPEVAHEHESILRFWLDRGVDGFRIDVAHGLVKAPGLPDAGPGQWPPLLRDRRALPQFDQDGVHVIYRHWRTIADGYDGDRVLVGEAWINRVERLARYVRPDELHQTFNFHFLQTPWKCRDLREVIDDSMHAFGAVGAPPTWVLSNHDVVRHRTRYAPDASADVSERRARAALLLVLALPGCVYLYQGEELGLPEVDLPEEALQDPMWERSGGTQRGRDGCRVPLPWAGTAPPFGFSPGDTSWLPMPPEWVSSTVAAQDGDPTSMLSFYRTALATRRATPALAGTELAWVDGPADVLAFRRDVGGQWAVWCAVNLGQDETSVHLPGRVLLASEPFAAAGDGSLLLPPDTAVWVQDRASAARDQVPASSCSSSMTSEA